MQHVCKGLGVEEVSRVLTSVNFLSASCCGVSEHSVRSFTRLSWTHRQLCRGFAAQEDTKCRIKGGAFSGWGLQAML